MSEPTRPIPSAAPTMIGGSWRATTIDPGWSTEMHTRAKAPSSWFTTRSIPVRRSQSSLRRIDSMRCATTSVSVSERNSCPSSSSRPRRTSWFSMIPLCTTATRPEQSTCGCAFSSVGGPCVAHRVWPMPNPPDNDRSFRASTRLCICPARRSTCNEPFEATATPAESYPRYSNFAIPSSRMGSACPSPM